MPANAPVITKRIIQIIPATGWLAAYRDDETPAGLFFLALACWALMEASDGDRSVEGLAGSDWLDSVEDSNNFAGYFQTEEEARESVAISDASTAKAVDHAHQVRAARAAAKGGQADAAP